MKKNKLLRWITLTALTVFALLTLFLSGSVLFDWYGIQAKKSNYVPFVVWSNFLSSGFYLSAAYGLFKQKIWAVRPLIVSVLILAAALVGLFVHIEADGQYETKTIGALVFRTAITLVFTFLTYIIMLKWKNRR